MEREEESRKLTQEEKAHLLRMATVAGSPAIVKIMIDSGDIFDPAHMERAQAMSDEWERLAAAAQATTTTPP